MKGTEPWEFWDISWLGEKPPLWRLRDVWDDLGKGLRKGK